jgi:IS30 family transposase
MPESDIKLVAEKLETLIRLVATAMVADKPRREQIRMLSTSRMQPKQIAELIGTTPGTVSVELTAIRKKAKARKVTRRKPNHGRAAAIQPTPATP